MRRHMDMTTPADVSLTDRSGGGVACGVRTECVVGGREMVAALQQLVEEGDLRRIWIKGQDGRTLIEIPLTLGLVGAPLQPVWAALGALSGTGDEFAVVVQREEAWPRRRVATEPQDETAGAPDRVDQQSEQSFPASDAPSWGGLRL